MRETLRGLPDNGLGGVAERRGGGLQNRKRAFESHPYLFVMYKDCTIYGPYRNTDDNRARIVIKFPNGRCTTRSYPKYLMELYLGRYLTENEQVHHKDENVLNDTIDNFEIKLLGEHQREHRLKYKQEITAECEYCKILFMLSPRQQITLKANQARGKTGPFCSRRCVGKYGREQQMSA